ncbi:MAG: hypothetical protein K8M05_23035, partial [Deltaproteobacteria bacterium]|nr:hypothetical protein [Kofleriaceae bacterium]
MRPCRSILALVILSALAAACGSSSRPAPGTCEADCVACVADLERWLGQLVDEGEAGLRARPRDLDLVPLPAGLPLDPLTSIPAIAIGREALAFEGMPVTLTAELLAQPGVPLTALTELMTEHWKQACTDAPDTVRSEVMVHVDPTIPWHLVRRVVAAVDAVGLDAVRFSFATPSALPPPGRSAIDGEIERIEARLRSEPPSLEPPAPDPRHPFELTYGACKHARDGWIAAGGRTAAGQRDFVMHDLPALIGRCGCKVDAPSVKALQWWWSGRRDGLL